MDKIGTKKAVSYDGMMDIIFQKKYYEWIKIEGNKPDANAPQIEKNIHARAVKRKLIKRLQEYINLCIREKTKL